MLQYLLNSSAIWLLSLMVFDAFLKKETFHTYNRLFLLFTLLLGFLLPLYSWGTDSVIYASTFKEPVAQVTEAKASIIQKTTPTHGIGGDTLLIIIYLAGVLTGIILLARDIVKLKILYRNGYKWQQGAWTIVETGKDHTPFSFRKIIFVSDRERYSPAQWSIILLHEQQHALQLHLIDLILVQTARIIYWFNPLVHVYYKRLLMVHEFQADAVATAQPAQYGEFLIEQSLMGNAPAISHSFNYPNVKTRIRMLTHHTSQYKQLGKLAALPLLVIFLACCTKSAFTSSSPVRKGNLAYYKGNEFLFGLPRPADTITIENPVTKEQMIKVAIADSIPVSMNGKPIFYYAKGFATDVPAEKLLDAPNSYLGSDQHLRNYLVKNMQDELGKLDDGVYRIKMKNIVVDEYGKIAYYEYSGIEKSKPIAPKPASAQETTKIPGDNFTLRANPDSHYGPEAVNKTIQTEVAKKISSLVEAVNFTPAMKDGATTISISSEYLFFQNYFKVEGHRVMDFNKELGTFTEL